MFIDIHIDPMKVQRIVDRENILDSYALNFVNNACDHETRKDFCEQAAADLKDKSVVFDLMVKIRRLEGQRRRAA
jgi:hypothetical protein